MPKEEDLTPKSMTLKIVNKMKYGGCSPMHQTFWLKFIANFYIINTGTIFLLSIVNIMFSSETMTINLLMEDILMVVAFLQICAKLYIASRQTKELLVMLDIVFCDFWPIDNGLLNKEEEVQMRFLYRLAIIVGFIYGCFAYSAVLLFASHALLKHTFITAMWFPVEGILMTHPYYEITYTWQTFITFSSVYFSVVQMDSLFIYFVCFLYVQLKLLQKKIATIVKENATNENYTILKECVEHHNKLIQFLQYLSGVYAKIFLPTFFTNFVMFALTIYGVQIEDSVNGKLKNVAIFACILGQLFAYCFGGQIIQDQGSEIADTVYNLEWLDIRDINLRKGFVMIILRCQRPLQLSIAGFLILDMRSLAMVIRGCFSFIAFLANVQ